MSREQQKVQKDYDSSTETTDSSIQDPANTVWTPGVLAPQASCGLLVWLALVRLSTPERSTAALERSDVVT